MFIIESQQIIVKKKNIYCSFPDVIKSKKTKNKLFLVYREGNSHHPTWSKLVFLVSKNNGRTWKMKKEFHLNIERNGCVWNCPRLSYIDNTLCIVCDKKSSTFERTAQFSTSILSSNSEGTFFNYINVPFPGMVPDRIVKFKNKLFCANHKIKSPKNDLIQLVSWSRDNGRLWYDTSIIANDTKRQYCEASIMNIDDKYLIAYLRDNSGHQKSIYYTKSEDGTNWSKPEALGDIVGQRVTAIRDDDIIIGTYRNTKEVKVSLFYYPVNKEQEINKFDIDEEYPENMYHFGYSGITKISDNRFLVAYYIRNDFLTPVIKTAIIKRN